MRTYSYWYESETLFSGSVTEHSFLLRPMPMECPAQTLLDSSLQVMPLPDSLGSDTDIWGNTVRYGIVHEPHASFRTVSNGHVLVTGSEWPDLNPNKIFLAETKLTAYSDEMQSLATPGCNLKAALAMAKTVNSTMSYCPGSTEVLTTGADSFRQKRGVCQDFAHILISICRKNGIPARYVCGFVVGEGQTHAWTQVWDKGAWWGIDPTAGELCNDRYITVAVGRDAQDCSVSRGMFFGSVIQRTTANVLVEEKL